MNIGEKQITTPAYKYDPETPKVVPRDQWDIPLISDKINDKSPS